MSRRICYITGTRADYGLMANTLKLAVSKGLDVQLCVTGMHLLDAYGNTVADIEADDLPIAARIPVSLDGSHGSNMAYALAEELKGMTTALQDIAPDLVVVLGDRGEMLAGALAALHLNLPTLHIHGGELSGTVDEPIRHAISKLSHYHATATISARDRLIRMGEHASNICVTGAPGLDEIYAQARTPRTQLLEPLGLDTDQPLALVVFHPVVQEAKLAGEQMQHLLQSLDDSQLQALILSPNADAGGAQIESQIAALTHHEKIRTKTHLSRCDYLSWLAAVDVMIGNSSSGIIEAASVGTQVVNIGSRQHGRERNPNVHECGYLRDEITATTRHALNAGRYNGPNCYGDGNAASRIIEWMQTLSLDAACLRKVNAY